MLRFLVCQTSISIGAGEVGQGLDVARWTLFSNAMPVQVLGQIAFQEHFPIDGVAQD